MIIQRLLGGALSKDVIHAALVEEIPDNRIEQTDHALRFLAENDVIVESHGVIKLNCDAEPEFKEFVADLLEYGITDFIARYHGENEDDFLMGRIIGKTRSC